MGESLQRSSYVGIHCATSSWVHALPCKTSRGHGIDQPRPMGPCARAARARGIATCISFAPRNSTSVRSTPRITEHNTQHTSQHCMMACQFTGACHVGDNTRDGSARSRHPARRGKQEFATESRMQPLFMEVKKNKKTKTALSVTPGERAGQL